jgi:hypothetical protein
MTVTAIISMVFICGFVIGGFLYFLNIANKKESK